MELLLLLLCREGCWRKGKLSSSPDCLNLKCCCMKLLELHSSPHVAGLLVLPTLLSSTPASSTLLLLDAVLLLLVALLLLTVLLLLLFAGSSHQCVGRLPSKVACHSCVP